MCTLSVADLKGGSFLKAETKVSSIILAVTEKVSKIYITCMLKPIYIYLTALLEYFESGYVLSDIVYGHDSQTV